LDAALEKTKYGNTIVMHAYGKPQKKSSTNGRAIKRGVRAGPLKKKKLFFKTFFETYFFFVAI